MDFCYCNLSLWVTQSSWSLSNFDHMILLYGNWSKISINIRNNYVWFCRIVDGHVMQKMPQNTIMSNETLMLFLREMRDAPTTLSDLTKTKLLITDERSFFLSWKFLIAELLFKVFPF